MAALSRKESEERQQAVLRFFVDNPRSTGDEAQRALTSGRLLGKKGQPPMGLGMLFKLKRQAETMAARGVRLPEPPRAADSQLTEEQLAALRDRGHELQKLLSELPEAVIEVHITRDGVRVVRLKATEEEL
jgi:hypothetical protein